MAAIYLAKGVMDVVGRGLECVGFLRWGSAGCDLAGGSVLPTFRKSLARLRRPKHWRPGPNNGRTCWMGNRVVRRVLERAGRYLVGIRPCLAVGVEKESLWMDRAMTR